MIVWEQNFVLIPNNLECVSSLRSSSFCCPEALRKKVSVKYSRCVCIFFLVHSLILWFLYYGRWGFLWDVNRVPFVLLITYKLEIS